MTNFHITVQCFWMPLPFLTPRSKQHISDRNVNSIFVDLFPGTPVKFLFTDLYLQRISLWHRLGIIWIWPFSESRHIMTLATVQKEAIILHTLLLATRHRKKFDWVGLRHHKRKTNFVINAESLTVSKLHNTSHKLLWGFLIMLCSCLWLRV